MNVRHLLLIACASAGAGASFAQRSASASIDGAPTPAAAAAQAPSAGYPSVDFPASDAEAVRFLIQATFGPRKSDVPHLRETGYRDWIAEQLALPASLHRPYLDDVLASGTPPHHGHRNQIWWRNAMEGEDQLRGRVAWALSQILVVSEFDRLLGNDAIAVAEYYDILTRGAFDNFRELLESVTLSPAMGVYLSMLKNRKADAELLIRPDENYAREILQLFSIGLEMLAPDGTPLLAGAEQVPIPTYDQALVEELARTFTGWNYAGATEWESPTANTLPMECWPEYHDGEEKVLFGVVLPAGQSCEADLEQALDIIFAHPNVGPFLGRQLIQRLVTSNPSPAYVARVSAAFEDNGSGARGDLGAVVAAILLDPEARSPSGASTSYGKVKEPILKHAHLWRTFDAFPQTGTYVVWDLVEDYAQAPVAAPSVFNFYSPFHRPPGLLADVGLFAPELQIIHHTTMTTATNRLGSQVLESNEYWPAPDPWQSLIQTSEENALAAEAGQLVEHLDTWLMGGTMSGHMRAVLRSLINDTPYSLPDQAGGALRSIEAIFAIFTSAEFAVQR